MFNPYYYTNIDLLKSLELDHLSKYIERISHAYSVWWIIYFLHALYFSPMVEFTTCLLVEVLFSYHKKIIDNVSLAIAAELFLCALNIALSKVLLITGLVIRVYPANNFEEVSAFCFPAFCFPGYGYTLTISHGHCHIFSLAVLSISLMLPSSHSNKPNFSVNSGFAFTYF